MQFLVDGRKIVFPQEAAGDGGLVGNDAGEDAVIVEGANGRAGSRDQAELFRRAQGFHLLIDRSIPVKERRNPSAPHFFAMLLYSWTYFRADPSQEKSFVIPFFISLRQVVWSAYAATAR